MDIQWSESTIDEPRRVELESGKNASMKASIARSSIPVVMVLDILAAVQLPVARGERKERRG
jgi:hypothetical protein